MSAGDDRRLCIPRRREVQHARERIESKESMHDDAWGKREIAAMTMWLLRDPSHERSSPTKACNVHDAWRRFVGRDRSECMLREQGIQCTRDQIEQRTDARLNEMR